MPGASSPPGVMIRRTIPLPSRAKMEAILQARRKSATVTVARPAKLCGINWEYLGNVPCTNCETSCVFFIWNITWLLLGLTVISTVSSSSAISRLSSFKVLEGIMTSAFSLTARGQRHSVNCQAEAVGGGQGDGVALELRIHAGQYRA